MNISIEQILVLVAKASAINSLNPEGEIRTKIRDYLNDIERGLKVYQIEEGRKKNIRSVEISNIEKKIQKEFADMTSSIMDLVKIKSLP